MTQTACPHCGKPATLLPDGAVYCVAEHRVVVSSANADAPLRVAGPPAAAPATVHRAGSDGPEADPVAEVHWRSAGRAVVAGFGAFNVILFLFVLAALGAAIAGALVVLVL